MFNRINVRLIIGFMLLVIYNFFFWKEKMGINLMIFSYLAAGSVLLLNHKSLTNRKIYIILAAIIFSGIMVVVHNSFYSKFAVFTSLMLLGGYAHQPDIKAVFSSYFSSVLDYFMVPVVFAEGIKQSREKSKVFRIISRTIKLALIPLFIVFIFYIIYTVSNEKFNFYSQRILKDFSDFIYEILKDYTFVRFMYLVLGAFLITGILHARSLPFLKNFDLMFRDKLSRHNILKLVWLNSDKRYKPLFRSTVFFPAKMNSLSTENRIGIILLVLVNILILGLNAVDIKYLWLSFDAAEIQGFSDWVYAGTYLLIFSITLSMFILMYLFRGNLNFYKKNPLMVYLAYAWIAQNAFMAASVWLRNYYYIIYTHTISYRKIGVIIFLILTFIGLVTMVMKISQKRTAYSIFKINSWAVFGMLLAMSSFNWDKNIADYNLANPQPDVIDIAYLLELSDDVLPALYEKKELMNKDFYIPRSRRIRTVFASDYFYDRVQKFKKEQEGYSWLSWNYPDEQIYKYFTGHEVNGRQKKSEFE